MLSTEKQVNIGYLKYSIKQNVAFVIAFLVNKRMKIQYIYIRDVSKSTELVRRNES